jgi:hypothetical protein
MSDGLRFYRQCTIGCPLYLRVVGKTTTSCRAINTHPGQLRPGPKLGNNDSDLFRVIVNNPNTRWNALASAIPGSQESLKSQLRMGVHGVLSLAYPSYNT